MQVFSHIALKSVRSVRGRRQTNFYSDWFNVVRLFGPVRESHERGTFGRGYIYADIEIPEDLRAHASVLFNGDGTARVQVWVNTHRKTLAPVLDRLADGDAVIHVRDML
ncbi:MULTISPECIES: hypothetical protein [Paraburkholderia]|uniref:hypothetical protein n=1 Tax=Paraburkholderia TaxID=1822464 RepID=UPI0015C5463D|nr:MULTISPECIES: hypothetical protein [Paraburkholderia]MDR8398261.1 hypothetical protein [Paraburkholderia sp. USG1]NPT38566.1 hypothetical protein [Paraburkholderia xenovorans]